MKSRRRTSEFNFWPSVADMILAVLMTFLLLWFAEKFLFLSDLTATKKGIAKLEENLNRCQIDMDEAKKQLIQRVAESTKAQGGMISCTIDLGKCERDKEECQANLQKCQTDKDRYGETLARCETNLKGCQEAFQCDKPPMITLDEASGYKFPTGKANLSEDFKAQLQDKLKDIQKELHRYKANVIEVIGHTDGQVAGGQSNLDRELGEVVAGRRSIDTLRYGSNADLGLMRALAVVLFLKQQQEFAGIKFRVYSAAQILPNGELAEELDREPDEQRRRIELRFTRLEK
jgi:outer membrane protein OmpA-like peptidoglycan-associated protein